MRPLLVSSIAAIAVLFVGCGGSSSHRAALSAKAWDTPFVTIKPIRNEDPNAAAHQRQGGRAAWSQAAYGQMPASIDPTALAAEMEAMPGMTQTADVAAPVGDGAASQAVVAEAVDQGEATPKAVVAPAVPALTPAVVTMPALVVPASFSPPQDDWYDRAHVDLMARSDWAGQDDGHKALPR